MADFLHERRDFDQLLAVVANERALDPMLVEKDYWIMHSLWGLQAQGFVFDDGKALECVLRTHSKAFPGTVQVEISKIHFSSATVVSLTFVPHGLMMRPKDAS